MDQMQSGVLALLKSAVTQVPVPLPEEFDLDAAVLKMKKHSLSTMLYDGAVRCGISKKNETMRALFKKYCKVLMISEGQMTEVARIFAAFEAAGIDYMPVKGCKLKPLYPKPEFRIMGDADILVRVSQYDRIRQVMEGLGFDEKEESDHEWIWQSGGLYLELHKRLIPSYNRDFYGYFGDGWQRAHSTGAHRYEMSAEDELVYLFTHFAKHFRDGGIGCRHVVDLWVYLRTHPELEEAYVRRELEKLGLLDFYSNILDLIGVWFLDRPENEKTGLIGNFIFESGNWGAWESRFLSQMVRATQNASGHANARLVHLGHVLFPGVKTLEKTYPVLKKAPWLLPGIWLVRPFAKLLNRDAIRRQEHMLSTASREKVDAHRAMLQYVGLEYRP